MKAKLIIGGIIILVFVSWAMSSFMKTTIRYISINEVPESSGVIQVMGKIDFASVAYSTDSTYLSFDVTGLEAHTTDDRIRVIYTGVIPGNFEQATSVVARGQYKDNALVANELLVKCPSKYQGLEEGV